MTAANQEPPDQRDQPEAEGQSQQQGGKSGSLGPRPGAGVNKRTTRSSTAKGGGGGKGKKSLLRRSLDPDNNNMNQIVPFVSTPADTPSPFPEQTPLQSDADTKDAKYEGERARNNQSAKRSRIRKALYVVELDNAVTGYEYNFKLFQKLYKEAWKRLADHGMAGDLLSDPPIWSRKPIPKGQDDDTQDFRKKLEAAVESGELIPLGLDFAESVALQVGKTTGSAKLTEEVKALQDAKEKLEKTVKQEDKYVEEVQDMKNKLQELQHKLWEVQHNRQSLGTVVDHYQAKVSGEAGDNNNTGPSALQGGNLPYRPLVPETAHLPQRLQKMSSQGRKERTLEELAASWPVRSCLESHQMMMAMTPTQPEPELEQQPEGVQPGDLQVATFDGFYPQGQQQQQVGTRCNLPQNFTFDPYAQAQGEPNFLPYANDLGNPDAVPAAITFGEHPWPGEGVGFTGEPHLMGGDGNQPGTIQNAALQNRTQTLSPGLSFDDLQLSPEMGTLFMETSDQGFGDQSQGNQGNFDGSYGQQPDQSNQFHY